MQCSAVMKYGMNVDEAVAFKSVPVQAKDTPPLLNGYIATGCGVMRPDALDQATSTQQLPAAFSADSNDRYCCDTRGIVKERSASSPVGTKISMPAVSPETTGDQYTPGSPASAGSV